MSSVETSAESEKGLSVWNSVVSAALKLPLVEVDRNPFLTSKFKQYCNADTLDYMVGTCPAMCVNEEIVKSVAAECIAKATRNVTTISTVAGLPGGLAMLGTIPADLAQFYGHVFRLCQELAYIYGYPDLRDNEGKFTEESINILTLFVGVMMDVEPANEGVHDMAQTIAQQVAKELPRVTMAKATIYPLARTVAAWLGVRMTRSTVARGVSKVIPLIGGAISGTLTYVSFKPMAKKLNEALSTDMYLLTERFKSH